MAGLQALGLIATRSDLHDGCRPLLSLTPAAPRQLDAGEQQALTRAVQLLKRLIGD